MKVQKLVQELIHRKGFTLQEIADEIDYSYHAVYYWYYAQRRKKEDPPLPIMRILRGMLRKSPDAEQ